MLAGLDNIYIKPGMKVLYLGAASGTSVSHCSDIVGPEGALLAASLRSSVWRSVALQTWRLAESELTSLDLATAIGRRTRPRHTLAIRRVCG